MVSGNISDVTRPGDCKVLLRRYRSRRDRSDELLDVVMLFTIKYSKLYRNFVFCLIVLEVERPRFSVCGWGWCQPCDVAVTTETSDIEVAD